VKKVVLNSYAKLNLYLEVLNIRSNAYHNIKTVFERIDLSDKIILRPRSDRKINILCKNPRVPRDRSNLCYQSAQILQKMLGINLGVDIEIIKRIPISAGLGGGSSNAASILLGLDELYKLNLSQDQLLRLAKEIGSDVAFFIYNIPFALGTCRGDKIEKINSLNKVRLWHILVVPRIEVSTRIIYKKWDAYSKLRGAGLTPPFLNSEEYFPIKRAGLTEPENNVNILILGLRKKDLSLIGKFLYNSLENITLKLYPQVKDIKKRLAGFGLKSVLMSGSGPAVFGIASSGKEARCICEKLRRENRSWQVFVTRTH
jgi:4-diphosphocytidyl-2-C-methyl-D-erythritol kinase